MSKLPEACPACAEPEGVSIAWGAPDEFERTDEGLGGCRLQPDPPTTRCRACGHQRGAERFSREDAIPPFRSAVRQGRLPCRPWQELVRGSPRTTERGECARR